jgi:hypothetical protein
MLIQLTNATEALQGNAILVNTEMVLSIYRDVKIVNEESVTEVTYVFCPPHGSWEVQETPEQIADIVNGKTSKPKVKVTTGKTNGK